MSKLSKFEVDYKVVVLPGDYSNVDDNAAKINLKNPIVAIVVDKIQQNPPIDNTKYPDGYLYHVETDDKRQFVIASKDAYIPETNDLYGNSTYNKSIINIDKVNKTADSIREQSDQRNDLWFFRGGGRRRRRLTKRAAKSTRRRRSAKRVRKTRR